MSDIEAIRDTVKRAVDRSDRYSRLRVTSAEFYTLVTQLPHMAALVERSAARTCQPDQVWRVVAGFIVDALAMYADDAESVEERRRLMLKQAMLSPGQLLDEWNEATASVTPLRRRP